MATGQNSFECFDSSEKQFLTRANSSSCRRRSPCIRLCRTAEWPPLIPSSRLKLPVLPRKCKFSSDSLSFEWSVFESAERASERARGRGKGSHVNIYRTATHVREWAGKNTSRRAWETKRRRKAYVVPVAGSAAVHVILAAFVPIDHLLFMIDRFVPRLGLLTQRIGDLLPGLLVDDRELVPAVVVEKWHDRLGHLRSIDNQTSERECKLKSMTHLRVGRLCASERWNRWRFIVGTFLFERRTQSLECL